MRMPIQFIFFVVSGLAILTLSICLSLSQIHDILRQLGEHPGGVPLPIRKDIDILFLSQAGLAIAAATGLGLAIDRELRWMVVSARIASCLRWLRDQFEKPFWSSREMSIQGLQQAVESVTLELLESRRQRKLLFERAVDVICVVGADGLLTNVSPAAKKSWGYQPIDLEGRSIASVLRTPDAERILSLLRDSTTSIDKIYFESQVQCKDGSMLDVAWTGHFSPSEGGLFCIVHDISQQKRTEKSIRQNETRLRVALESLPMATLVIDVDNCVEFANGAAHVLLGYGTEDMMGTRVTAVFPDEHLLEQDDTPYDKGIATIATCKDGSHKDVDVWMTRLEVLENETKVLMVFVDKTAQIEFEKVKNEFMAMITHDLRSPLSAVIGMLALLEQGVLGTLSERGKQIASGSQRECQRMLRLLNDLLQLEKMASGSFELECKPMDLNATIREALEQVRRSAESKQLSLKVDLQFGTCFGDHERLMQVMINLLNNAIKYAPPKSQIRVKTGDFGPYVMATVEDRGPGIPEEKLEKIFESYGQVDLNDARKHGGTGLGLSICKAIVQQHGGHIGVDTAVNQGSRFWFTVPKQAQPAVLQ
jgi:PAS domain S-box-containing protein